MRGVRTFFPDHGDRPAGTSGGAEAAADAVADHRGIADLDGAGLAAVPAGTASNAKVLVDNGNIIGFSRSVFPVEVVLPQWVATALAAVADIEMPRLRVGCHVDSIS
jgi:hypothetical protein